MVDIQIKWLFHQKIKNKNNIYIYIYISNSSVIVLSQFPLKIKIKTTVSKVLWTPDYSVGYPYPT